MSEEAGAGTQPLPAQAADMVSNTGVQSKSPDVAPQKGLWNFQALTDATADLHLRAYRFDYERSNGSRSLALAIGGEASVYSGKWWTYYSAGLGVATSQKISGELDQDGTSLLIPGQESYTVIHIAYVQAGFDELEATVYRQMLNLPFINKQDSRMTPNTFEAMNVQGKIGLGGDFSLDYIAGYAWAIKQRNSDTFRGMDAVVGAEDDQIQGVFYLNARGRHGADIDYGVTAESLYNAWTTLYGAATWNVVREKDVGLRFDGQATYQYIDERIQPEPTGTGQLGVRLVGSWNGFTGRLAATKTGSDNAILSPYGDVPFYLSMMIRDFDNPGEFAGGAGVVYKLTEGYAEGLGLNVGGTVSDGGDDYAEASEVDVTLEYLPPGKGWWDGLWFRLRYAEVVQDGFEDATQWRVIVDYSRVLR